MLLVIDNYDSFTYNLVQYFGQLGVEQKVYRNDQITVAEALALNPDRVMISPGPCSPAEAGVSCDMIRAFAALGINTKYLILNMCQMRLECGLRIMTWQRWSFNVSSERIIIFTPNFNIRCNARCVLTKYIIFSICVPYP